MKDVKKQLNKIKQKEEEHKKRQFEFYSLRRILGNSNWAIFYILLGAREAGKWYSCSFQWL